MAALQIINHLKGGIGNQLFQICFGHALAERLAARLTYDVGYFTADPYGRTSILSRLEPDAAIGVARLDAPGTYLLRDGVLHHHQDLLQLPADAQQLVLDGYWQTRDLIDPAAVAALRQRLRMQCAALDGTPAGTRIRSARYPTAIHLRGHDYAHMGVCRPEYYLACMDALVRQFPDSHFFVFSDQPNATRALFGQRYANLEFPATGDDLDDLYLMSLCRRFVISNSTYSWWAARLAEVDGASVIAPAEWVLQPDASSPCPAHWTLVPGVVQALQTDPSVQTLIGAFLAGRL